MSFKEYVEHGWKLCRIVPGQKRPRKPRWNYPEMAITDPVRASHLQCAGLCHAYSGTCALDVDRYDDAAAWLKENGVDLDALRLADDAVHIISGQANRGKLLYSLPEPLPSVSLNKGAFELRCGTKTGRTAQDVLPPSVHPNGKKYSWKGDWRKLPPLPDSLRTIWLDAIGPDVQNTERPEPTGDTSALQKLLATRDPDCSYEEWLRVGMAVHHETNGSPDGLVVWDMWSSGGEKYAGFSDLQPHWESFGNAAHPVTAGSLRAEAVATVDDFDTVEDPAEEWFPKPENRSKREMFRFLSLGELFERPEPPWLIPDVLPQAALGVIWGQPSSGKTFVAVDLAITMALGEDWRGINSASGKVLYVAAEDDAGVQSRFAAGLAARGVQDAPVLVLPAAPSLLSKEQANALYASIVATGDPRVIFLDTLAAVTPGANENDGKDMTLLIAYCQRLHRATGALVILIHHEGKGGRGIRGHSSLPGALDVSWEVSREKDKRIMTIAKLKNAPDGMRFPFSLQEYRNSCVINWR